MSTWRIASRSSMAVTRSSSVSHATLGTEEDLDDLIELGVLHGYAPSWVRPAPLVGRSL